MNSNHLNTRLVWYSNGRFVSGCQIFRYSNGGLKTRLKNPVYGPKCPVLESSAKSRDYHLKSDNHTVRDLGVRYSDCYCMWELYVFQETLFFCLGLSSYPIDQVPKTFSS